MTPAMPKLLKARPLASPVLPLLEGEEVLEVLDELSRRLRESAHPIQHQCSTRTYVPVPPDAGEELPELPVEVGLPVLVPEEMTMLELRQLESLLVWTVTISV